MSNIIPEGSVPPTGHEFGLFRHESGLFRHEFGLFQLLHELHDNHVGLYINYMKPEEYKTSFSYKYGPIRTRHYYIK